MTLAASRANSIEGALGRGRCAGRGGSGPGGKGNPSNGLPMSPGNAELGRAPPSPKAGAHGSSASKAGTSNVTLKIGALTVEAHGQFQTAIAHRIAGRLTDDRVSIPWTGPEIFDIGVVTVVGYVVDEESGGEPAVVGLERGAQIQQSESALNGKRILIRQHLRRSSIRVGSAEQQFIGNSLQRHALFGADVGLEFGRIRHGVARYVLHQLGYSVDRDRR